MLFSFVGGRSTSGVAVATRQRCCDRTPRVIPFPRAPRRREIPFEGPALTGLLFLDAMDGRQVGPEPYGTERGADVAAHRAARPSLRIISGRFNPLGVSPVAVSGRARCDTIRRRPTR